MPNPYRDRIFETLWPARAPRWSKICAVLDCARDEQIFTAVERCHLDKSCLYAGRIPWVLQRAAPHLVVLEPGDPFTQYLLDEGWGNSWGVFLRTELPMLEVRRHLRSLLRVRDESGKYFIFRWYDPRVLRVYLPTCLIAELRTVFGPVETFYCEGDLPSRIMEYSFDGMELTVRKHVVAGDEAMARESGAH